VIITGRPFCERLAGAALHLLPQGLAFDKLADDEMALVYLADLVNGDDVRVVERRSCARFLFEAPHPLGV
jgi:hypothetical protein